MNTLGRSLRSLPLVAVAALSFAACSGGTPTSGTPTSGAPAATSQGGGASSGGGSGSAPSGATTSDYCTLFSLDEMAAVTGVKTRVADTGETGTCEWFTDDGTTLVIKKDEVSTCTGDESLVKTTGQGQIQGTTFVGPAIAGIVMAGTVVNGACYEVFTSNGPAPKLDALSSLLQQFVQRAQA